MLKIATEMSDDARTFSEQRYLVVRQLLSEAELRSVQAHAAVLFASGRFARDKAFARSLCLYGDPGFDSVLEWFAANLGGRLGLDLCPTYSYARIYGQGDSLNRHRDREACEVSATVAVKVPKGGDSTIHLKTPAGREVALTLAEGDACLYAGIEVEHWREPVARGGIVQLFLHYIRKDGTHYPRHRFDRRAQLGMPSVLPASG